MKAFISSLQSTNESSIINTPSSISNFSINESDIVDTITYGPLSNDDVRVLYMIGHSQISGKGDNADSTTLERAYNNSVMWGSGGFTPFSVPSTGYHGRELGINAYYKNYFDASHVNDLHLVKYVIRGACPYTIFLLGTKYFTNFWNNIFVPSINSILNSGKIPVVHFIHDIFLGLELYPITETNRYDLKAAVYSILCMLKIQNINISFTGDGEPIGGQGAPNNVLSNNSIKSYISSNPTYLKYADKLNQPTTDDLHLNYAGLMHCSLQHLQHIQDQPLVRITRLLQPISDSTLITYKGLANQRDVINIKTDKSFDVIIQSDGVRYEQKNTTEIAVDVRLQRIGFISIIGNLSGITRFEAPYVSIFSEFDFIEKYGATLNYIDIRGNALQPIVNMLDYSNDKQLQYLVTGNVSNGTLLMAGSQVPLTIAARSNYDILISRGWTIDVARP